MDKVLQRFQDLKIQLEEIKSATDNFNDEKNCIGVGGFGKVYKGEVSHSEGRSMVAIKRLNRKQDQGDAEFLKEITTLSRYKHENLISLLGFCYQGDEAILVYQFASRGSLEEHLGSRDLTWSKRIKICLDAAKGLRHLHDPKGTHQRLIHCDVKSGNILLDDQWNAKVADFGFSIMGPANELQSTVINLAAGTRGYCDPQYAMTNTLTKESDVYSFGVVLVEVLCGALCYTYSNGSVVYNLVPTWTKSYEEKKLNEIIFKSPTTQPLYQSSLETFSDIAYRCLKESREDRPKMSEVVTELETALQNQEFKSSCYDDVLKSAEPPLNYRSEDELMMLLSKGVLLNSGKTYFSLNKMGEHCEMISIAECLGSEFESGYSEYNSRFPKGTYRSEKGIFKTRVKTQFLSLGITYAVNLVFKFRYKEKVRRCEDIYLKYKLQGETETLVSNRAYEREDGWWMAKLHQFTCDHKIVDLQFLFDGFESDIRIEAEGIEFRPLEKWFSLNKKGEHSEMISIAECLTSEFKYWGKHNSRLPEDTYLLSVGIFKTHVKTQFLSPGITYTVNLVFKSKKRNMVSRCEPISLKYKLQGEAETSVSYLAYEREDGWLMAELYQFTCDHEVVHLQILFEGFVRRYGTIEVGGIEFLPLEKVEHKQDEKQPVSDGDHSDENWEEKLPGDYEDIMKRSINSLQWTTKEEAYSIMRKGFLILEKWSGSIWFSLDKNGKKCIMISTRSMWNQSTHISLPESRFGKASLHNFWSIELKEEFQSQLVSSETTYAIYFVYKVSKDQSGFEAPMEVEDKLKFGLEDKISYIYLVSPQTPVIKPKADQNTHNPPSKLIKESLPQQRNDGWMEVQLMEFRSTTTTEMIPMRLELKTVGDWEKKFRGLIIEGIEIRPI